MVQKQLFFIIGMLFGFGAFAMDSAERAFLERIAKLPFGTEVARVDFKQMSESGFTGRVDLKQYGTITPEKAIRLLVFADQQGEQYAPQADFDGE